MLFENIVLLSRGQPPDVVPFVRAVPDGGYLKPVWIDAEIIGNLFDYCGEFRGQG